MPQETDEARSARLAPDAVARTTFPTSFRGYEPEHVRVFLEQVANELRDARDREAALRSDVAAAEAKAEKASQLDEAQLTAALGEETARVLLAAREAAAEIRAKGEDSVARLLREAQDEATRMKTEAEAVLEQRTKEAEAAAAAIRASAEAEATAAATKAAAIVEEARATGQAEADTILEMAKAHGRDMVEEALLVRTRVLEDLSRKRKAARAQLERLQGGRERLLESYEVVRRTLDEATAELSGSLVAAKRAADAAARRVDAEPAATVEQLEREVEAARDAGLPLVERAVEPEPSAEPEPAVVAPVTAEPEPEPEPQPIAVEPEPQPEAEPLAMEPEPAVAEVVIVDTAPDEETEATDVDVDDLFARIRAARAEETAKAREVLAQDDLPAADAALDDEVVIVEEVVVEIVADESAPAELADDEYAPAPVSADEQALLERRDAITDAAEHQATRKLKRVLADEQNEVLDRLRRNPKATVDDLLPSAKAHAKRFAEAAVGALAEAARGGAEFYGAGGDVGSVDDLADTLGDALALPLRDRLSDSLREAAGDDDALADGVRAAYRDWKAHRIAMQTRDVVFAAFNRGLYTATPEGSSMRWLVDDGGSPCPDAEDNSLAGLVTKGEPYPTGHCYPPAHPGCRCLLVPAPH